MKIIHLIALFAVVIAACSTNAPAPAPSDAAVAPPGVDAPPFSVDAFQRAHGITPTTPTPNPAWYGQGPLRNPKLLAASGGFGPPVYQASWATPAWWIDPVSGSDANDCVTTSTPCKTYAQVAARWGTYAPRLRQATVIHFKSTQPDQTDPIILRPFIDNGGSIVLQGEPTTALQTGTLSGVVSMVRSTGTLLTATIGAGGAVGQLVQNTTHSSYAWLYKLSSGTTWFFTRPLAPVATVPYQWFNSGTTVDTWANGDAYSIFQPVGVYIEDFEPIIATGNSVFGLSAYVYHLNVAPVNATTLTTTNLNVSYTEASTNTPWNTVSVNGPVGLYQYYALNAFLGVVDIGLQGGFFGSSGQQQGAFVGGYVVAPIGGSVAMTKGVILDATFSATIGIQGGALNDVFIQSGTTMGIQGLTQVTGPIWGPGTLNVQGTSRLIYPSAGGAAVANFLQTGFAMNNATTACSHTNVNPDVVSCAITVTAAHLDAAQGAAGFGGLASSFGGASISNGGF